MGRQASMAALRGTMHPSAPVQSGGKAADYAWECRRRRVCRGRHVGAGAKAAVRHVTPRSHSFSMQQRSCLRSLVPLLPLRLLSGGRPLRKPPQTRRHLHASRGAGQRGAVRPVHQDRPAGKKRVRRTSHQMNEALEQEARHAQEFKAAHKKATPEQKALLLAELQK